MGLVRFHGGPLNGSAVEYTNPAKVVSFDDQPGRYVLDADGSAYRFDVPDPTPTEDEVHVRPKVTKTTTRRAEVRSGGHAGKPSTRK